MTTVVLPPPAPAATAAAVVTSPSSKTTSSSCSSPSAGTTTTSASESADSQLGHEVGASEPEAEEKENDERDNNNSGRLGSATDVRKSDVNAVEEPAKSVTAPVASELRYKKRPRVSFESADIVEFEPTIYTTTVTSGGIPVGMSFTERSRSRRRLDSWELERTDARVGRQSYMEEGYLDPTERESILNKTGCDDTTMVVVEAEVNRIIADRRESNEVDFEFMYGLGEVDDSLVEEEEEEDDEEMTQQQGDEEEEEDEEETEEPQEEQAGGESSGGGFSSEEEDENDRTQAA